MVNITGRFLLQLFSIFFSILVLANATCAQTRKLPPFRMMQANGQVFKAESLPAGKPILLVYFSPECDHCQVFMKEFFKKGKDFSKTSVVMLTFTPVDKLAQFNKEHKTSAYSNIFSGTEGMKFFVRNYYNIMQMPFAALHDKNGNLIKTYSRDIPLKEVSEKLNSLK